jgi:D123 protein
VCPSALTIGFTLNDYIRPPKSTLEDDQDRDCDGEDEDTASGTVQYSFPELDAQIRATIDKYGGSVFPKLNFSSPKVRHIHF